MRKFIAVVLVEASLLCAAISLNMLTTIAPVWIWPTASVVCLVLAALIYRAEIKRWFFRKGPQTETDQEIKLDRLLGYMRREFDNRIEANIKFDAPEMTASVGVRPLVSGLMLLILKNLKIP